MTIQWSDDFDGSDVGSIDGRTLNNGLGGSESRVWVNLTGGQMAIVSNEAWAGGSAAAAMVLETRTEGETWLAFRLPTDDTQVASYALTNNVRQGPGIAGLVYSRTSLRILLLDDGSRYGTDVATVSMSTLALDTVYWLRLHKIGGLVTVAVYEADRTTLVATTSYDFGATVFANQYWGFSNYELEHVFYPGYEFHSLDAPPAGNALLLQLMQHGQLNGGLL